jgi:CheY-like chemotaxis protein
MGGTIGVDSMPGQGSRFWFTIRCRRGAAPMEERSETAPPVCSRALAILVAEDNPTNQSLIRALLERMGHAVDVVGHGGEAVAAVQCRSYDLVLMDVQMPKMDGVAATRAIRGLPGPVCGVPIIALTANALTGQSEEYLGAGMSDYLAKPIDNAALVAMLERWGGIAADAPAAAGEPHPLAQLLAQLGQERLQTLVAAYVADAKSRFERIRVFAGEPDLAAIARETHDMAGTLGNLGADRVVTLARRLNLVCKQGETEALNSLIAELGGALAETAQTLLAWCGRKAA